MTRMYLTTRRQEILMENDEVALPKEVKCIILDGPQESYSTQGEDTSCYYLFYGDFWGETIGNGRKFYNHGALVEEGERLAKKYEIELVNDSIPM